MPTRLHGFALGRDACLLRFFGREEQTRLLVVNFGGELCLPSISQPLVGAAGRGCEWQILVVERRSELWRQRHARSSITGQGWRIPGEAAVALHPSLMDGTVMTSIVYRMPWSPHRRA